MKHIIYSMSSFTLMLLFSFSYLNEDSVHKVDPAVLHLFEVQTTVDCLIQFSEKADLSKAKSFRTKTEKGRYVFNQLREVSHSSQKEVILFLNTANIPYTAFYIVNAISVKLTYDQLQDLRPFKNIKAIVHNPSVKMEKVKVEPNRLTRELPEPEWGILKIQADSVWNLGYKGENVVVGGQDTGFEWEHQILKHKYRGWNDGSADHNYNWHDAIRELANNPDDTIMNPAVNPCGLNSPFPCDDHNHGTHTMGTMVGSDTINATGVAPASKWIACRNMERGVGKPSTYLECFEWFLAPTDLNNELPNPEFSPDVINNSWSCPEDEGCNPTNWELMEDAVISLKSAGIVVVVSAGNEGSACSTIENAPSIFESSYTIGATRSNDTIANFSSRGPVIIDSSFRIKPNVSAPGVNVRSSVRNGEFRSFSGTSMAGPHVAGTVALIINANPELRGQVEVIENILSSSAEQKLHPSDCSSFLGQEIPNHVYGYGRINALRAVELALSLSSIDNEPPNTSQKFEVYPNPAIETITIVLDNLNKEDLTLSIFDLSGKLFHSSSAQISKINVKNFPNGIYLIRIRGRDFYASQKLVVAK